MEGHKSRSPANPQKQQQQVQQLPTSLQLHIMALLHPNDRALSGRFACRDAADALSGHQHCTASLSQPLPPHATPSAEEAGHQHVRQLPFRHKFQLLCTAAHSGSEVNLEVAWALLEPSVFPELLQHVPDEYNPYPDPGVAAVRAGHVQLLGWLLRRCPGLVRPDEVLMAAAQCCELVGLQQVWETLRGHFNSGRSGCSSGGGDGRPDSRRADLTQAVLNAAAKSHTPDAVAKMEWLLVAGADSCRAQHSTAAAAARTGDLGRMGWLRDRGCPFGEFALCGALQQAGLPVAQWLVGEGLCELPPRAGESNDTSNRGEDSSSSSSSSEDSSSCRSWDTLLYDAATGPDGVAKLQWLQEQGAPGVNTHRAKELALPAVGAGRVEVVQYLLSAVGPAAAIRDRADQAWFGAAAVKCGSTQMAEYLVKEAGLVPSHSAYYQAVRHGGLAMVRWLALEAGVSAAGCDLSSVVKLWPRATQADNRALLEAAQLLVGAGCSGWDANDAIAAAAKRGDLALVQYLHGQQPLEHLPAGPLQAAAVRPAVIDWSLGPHPVCFEAAVLGGCEAVLEWVAGQPGGLDNVSSPYRGAARQGDKGTLAALRRLGVPWGQQSLLVCALLEWRCGVSVVRWLEEQGAPVGDRAAMQQVVDKVIESNGLDVEEGERLLRCVEAAFDGLCG